MEIWPKTKNQRYKQCNFTTAHPKNTKTNTSWNRKRLKYDIKELRLHPEKLTKAFQDQQDRGETHESTHDWEEWETYQKTLGELLVKTYPLNKKETTAKEPEWALLLGKWGTRQEIDKFEHAYKKRDAIHQEIAKRAIEMRRRRRHMRQLEILLAWKGAARYLREHKKEIKYARGPIIDLGKTKRTYRASRGKQPTNRPIKEYVDWNKGK